MERSISSISQPWHPYLTKTSSGESNYKSGFMIYSPAIEKSSAEETRMADGGWRQGQHLWSLTNPAASYLTSLLSLQTLRLHAWQI
jgi:hypothetical protein